MSGPWTIGELATKVQQALTAAAYPGQKSGRIRDLPDRRTIRYYTTIGLLDKPSEMRGRTAYYGRRHLLQLVAIKRLQAQGNSLVEIQAALTGAGDSALARWAVLPDGVLGALDTRATQAVPVKSGQVADVAGVPRSSPTVRDDFWATAPQAGTRTAETNRKAAASVSSALHLKVLDHVTLVIEGVEADGLDAKTLSRLQAVLEGLKNVFMQESGNKKEPTKETKPSQTNDNERQQP